MDTVFQEKYVVIDLETTGNQAKHGDRIIQIGLCTIENGQITDLYAALVNPLIKIPPFIEQLTGISNQEVQDAPTIEKIVPEIVSRMAGAVVVAHNIHFDLSFLQHILEEYNYPAFSGLCIDTVELSRILLPDQKSYKLQQLADDFEMEHEHPHRADSDAYATAQLFLTLISKMEELPLVTIRRLIPLATAMHSNIETLLRRVERAKLIQIQDMPVEGIITHRQLALRKPSIEKAEKRVHNISLPTLEEILTSVLPDFEKRDGQEQLTAAIYQAFQEAKHGLFEVGTGTGKTFAYLVAALYWAKQQAEQIVVSTHTISLQEQMMVQEIPKLREALPFSFLASIVKGRHHYLCLRKFEHSLFSETDRNYNDQLAKMQLLVWLTETETGDVEELNLPSGGNDYWLQVHSESSTCLQHDCPWYEYCFYYRAKKKAQHADLVITNHSLILADLQMEQRLLPEYNYLIVDEAHHLQYVAIDQYGKSIKYTGLLYFLQQVILTDKTNLSQELKQALDLLDEGDQLRKKVEEITYLVWQMKEEIDLLFTSLYQLAEEKEEGYIEGNIKSARLKHDQEQGELWLTILLLTEKVQQYKLELLACHNQFLADLGKLNVQLSYSQRNILLNWNRMIFSISDQIQTIYQMLTTPDLDEHVYWIECEQKGARNSATIIQKPLYVDQVLARDLFRRKKSVILTSATLQIDHSFAYLKQQLGLMAEETVEAVITSPFTYEEQAVLLVPNYIAHISQVSEAEFAQEIAQELVDIAIQSKGRMLILFTSYHLLNLTYTYLKTELAQAGIALFAQGIDSGSRLRLIKNFQNQKKAILMGTYSFWEGIDIPGESLSCLIIVKLPFAPPHTPYYSAQAEQWKAEGKNVFMEYALPQAIIRFKQGFGRLIRRATDKGIIVVFDRRIIEAGYGQRFLSSLPPVAVHHVTKEELSDYIQTWLD